MKHLPHNHRGAILRLVREHGARNVCIFGSAARTDHTSESDLDALMKTEE